MLRRHTRGTGFPCLPLILCLLLGWPAATAAQNWEAVEIETIPVADNIFMLRGRGGNIGVSVGADGVFLIDDQFAPLTDKIVAAVGALSDRPIRPVFLEQSGCDDLDAGYRALTGQPPLHGLDERC